jgi:hypothetical protein
MVLRSDTSGSVGRRDCCTIRPLISVMAPLPTWYILGTGTVYHGSVLVPVSLAMFVTLAGVTIPSCSTQIQTQLFVFFSKE